VKKRAPKVEKVKGPTPTELKLALAEANRTISAITHQLGCDYEPRPTANAYPFSVFAWPEDTWQKRCTRVQRDYEHALRRCELAESAHRAMAEALTVAGREGYCTDDRGRVMSSRSSPLAVIAGWAGRGMTDKPENDGQVASGGGLAHGIGNL